MSEVIPQNELSRLIKLYQDKDNLELEVRFYKLKALDWNRINKALVSHVPKDKISASDALDISVDLGDKKMLRFSFTDPEEIEKISKMSSSSIYKYLSNVKPSKTVDIIIKDRGTIETLLLDDINAAIKLTTEVPNKGTSVSSLSRILYRYKNRYSFVLGNLRFDTTTVKQADNISKLGSAPAYHEAEIEALNKKVTANEIIKAVEIVVKAIQNSDTIITNTESKGVLEYFHNILGTSGRIINRNAVSMETQHIKFIPNKYAVTDKADGERYKMLIKGKNVYFITSNSVVIPTSIKLADDSLDRTILDGEYEESKNIYLAFDLIYSDGIDYRTDTQYTLKHRIARLNEIIKKAFTLIPFTDYADNHKDITLPEVVAFYHDELAKYWTKFKAALSKNKGLFITRKLYLIPYGIQSSEVFAYGDLLWKAAVNRNLLPYETDGVMYIPVAPPYYIKATPEEIDTVPLDYKWKPPTHNSIDFFVRYEKDANGEDAIFVNEGVEQKVANLFVGRFRGKEEYPVPFTIDGISQIARLAIIRGEARDSQGIPILDKSVVEFTYDSTLTGVDQSYKWLPYKNRPDKTESVQKYKKKYGNSASVASRVWNSIINPITEQIIMSLADPKTFKIEMDRLSAPKSKGYYNKVSANAVGMRAFHNWIKQNLIMSYGHKAKILEPGCGRGGEMHKVIKAEATLYVGFDLVYENMYTIPGSAVSRYNKIKHKAPPMYFIQADATLPLNSEAQSAKLSMNEENKKMIDTWLSKKYDVISAQFTLHYYLQDDQSWNTFCDNVNQTLSNGGYLLITTFDGKLVFDKLADKKNLAITYDDGHGNRVTLCDIVKVYSSDTSKRTGLAIDVHNALIQDPGQYQREYLVDPDFLIESLKQKCNLNLVETDSFYNIFQLYKGSFRGNNKQVREVNTFYQLLDEKDPETMASFKMSMLNRYYVFRKADRNQPSRVVGINKTLDSTKVLTPYFAKRAMIVDDDLKSKEINTVYKNLLKRYTPNKPSVYVVRHTIANERDRFSFSNPKKNGQGSIIMYKNPDGEFSPIKYKDSHIINSEKAINDLDTMVAITDLFE